MKLSLVTTLYYSEDYLETFYERAVNSIKKVTSDYEIIFVNDGSPDSSLKRTLELQKQDKQVVIIDLSRNFGHHRAIMTGLQHARGDYVFLIDSDLEEDPELFNTYWNEISSSENVDVIYGVQDHRKGGLVEKLGGRIWYLIFSYLSDIDYPSNSLTARLMSRRYVDNVVKFNEKELEIWGVFVLTGFNQKSVIASKGSKGTSTYSLARKLHLMVDSITSFSSKPLVSIFVLGLIITLVSFAFVVYLIVQRLVYEEIIAGWTSTLASIWFIGGLLIFAVGIIGIYLSKMFREIKNRPLSIIRNIYRDS